MMFMGWESNSFWMARLECGSPSWLLPLRADARIWCCMSPADTKRNRARRPRVGIPWRTTQEEEQNISRKLQFYFRAVEQADGEPVHVSLKLTQEDLAKQIAELAAFVLPGGPADINPELYDAMRHEKTHERDENREATDFAILEHALASGKPVLAICYGCQSLNVCLGGTLYQDIPSELQTDIVHSREGLAAEAKDPVHAARIKPGGELGQLAAAAGLPKRSGEFDVEINTSHHQAVRELGHGLRVAAVAPDGVIEAIEHEPHKHWVVGVQWHPERMTGHGLSESLFRALVQATRATTHKA